MSGAFFQDARLFRTLLDNLSEGVYFTDTQRRIQYWNPGAQRITGYRADEVLGHCCADNILMHTDLDGHSLCHARCPLAATMHDTEVRTARVFLQHKEGHRVPVRITTAAIRNDDEQVIGGLETFHDATQEMSALSEVEELKSKALLCPVTGVGNRAYAQQMLERRFEEMRANRSVLALIFMDIDHFKEINDRYGHAVGDVALKMVARTLANAMRNHDFLGRWGGEEFVAILSNLHKPQLQSFAERLRALVEHSSTTVSQGKLVVTVSVGAVIATQEDSIASLVARADALMYQSKAAGRNCVTLG